VTTEPCLFLQWDSEFFGIRIAQINSTSLSPELMQEIYQWCDKNAIECLYFLGTADNPESIRIAENNAFHLVEVRLTIERDLRGYQPPASRPPGMEEIIVRPAQDADLPALQRISRNSYFNSRFYFDDRFPEEACQQYYETWIKKSYESGADQVLVAEIKGEVLGYTTLHLNLEKAEGQVGLIAVAEDARKHGVGYVIGDDLITWFAQRGAERIIAVTQGRNIPTQRLSQRQGFLTKSCHLYYHKWFSEPEERQV
jgi:GNAT superfamily N-acetyltransferase